MEKADARACRCHPRQRGKHLSRSARGGASEAANAGGNATPPGRALGSVGRATLAPDHEGRGGSQVGQPHRREAGEGDFGRIVRLLILTGQCREEIGGARRSEIVGSFLRIGADRTKNGLPHDVSLVPAAIKALQTGLDLDDGQTWVFGTGAAGFQGWSKAKRNLDARLAAALKASGQKTAMPECRLHDIRRTVATRMAELGVLPHVVEAILNHTSGHKGGVAGVYNRATYAMEKEAALLLWAKHVEAITRTLPSAATPAIRPSRAASTHTSSRRP